MNKEKKHVVIVLGMHRTGSSAITRGLLALGVDLGSRLMEPIAGINEKGFFEDLDVYELNEALLHEFAEAWWTLTPLSPQALSGPIAQRFKLRAVTLVRHKLQSASFLGLKDPRFCKLLPFWQEVFNLVDAQTSYIITCRNPLSVAQSLTQRDGFDREKGYYLYLQYGVSSLVHTARQSRIVVDYDNVMNRASAELSRLSNFLGLSGFDPSSPAFTEYQNQFLENRLRHSQYQADDLVLDSAVPPSMIALYRLLQGLASDRLSFDTRKVASIINQLRSSLHDVTPALHYIRTCDENLIRLTHLVDDSEVQIGKLNQNLAEHEQTIVDFRHQQAESQQRIVTLLGEIDELHQQKSDLQKQLAVSGNQQAELQRRIVTLQQQTSDSQRQLALFRQQHAESQPQIEILQQEHAHLKQEINSVRAQLHDVLTSRSWRITEPLRSFRRSMLVGPNNGIRREYTDCVRKVRSSIATCKRFLTGTLTRGQSYKNKAGKDRVNDDVNIEFIIMIESGILEKQTVLLCKSIRRFTGTYADSPIIVISPRPNRRPSEATLAQLALLGVTYIPMSISSPCPEYGPSLRVIACARYEQMSRANTHVFLDSDTVFIGAPDVALAEYNAAMRPVDVEGMCTQGITSFNDPYWQELCKICEVDYKDIPYMVTTVDKQRVKASYNGGFTVTRRENGVLQRASDYFVRSVKAGLRPFAGRGGPFQAGHGIVSDAGSEYWGSSQACLSLALWGSGLSVRTLPITHNFPLCFYDELLPELKAGKTCLEIVHVHYHHLFCDSSAKNPILDGCPGFPSDGVNWLRERLTPDP